jgi:bifunctional UDP-N-acetylglucosamine pyrophosphorylase/glucosamine-1-phosphate N-acetyltransferase
MDVTIQNQIYQIAENLSSGLNYNEKEIAIILAAGHGKRIKSQRSKMLHKIWGVPTVERVYDASRDGIHNINVIVVVGIKAKDVMDVLGKRDATAYAFQEFQNGTGHAVQVALEKIDNKKYDGLIYVLPGDMGLIDRGTMAKFRNDFISSGSDMMVLTGIFDGKTEENAYGRIIRVKEIDKNGNFSGNDAGKVIEIMEFKDILALSEDVPYEVNFNGKVYSFTQKELIENNEFNSGVYAFKYKKLVKLINRISGNNAQGEIYITDLIALFNKDKCSVMAASPAEQYVVMGFNNKSVLKEMEIVARRNNYNKLKDIIEITDPDDFFIHETVIDQILELDKKNIPLDITIGKGAHIGRDVKLNYNIEFKQNCSVEGAIIFGEDVIVGQNVQISAFSGQVMKIGNNVEILTGDILKGNIVIGDGSRIESDVRMTGSSEFPLLIGKEALIKGATYIFGSIIEDGVHIEHSIIIKKRIERLVKKSGGIQPIRFYFPHPEGIDAIEEL